MDGVPRVGIAAECRVHRLDRATQGGEVLPGCTDELLAGAAESCRRISLVATEARRFGGDDIGARPTEDSAIGEQLFLSHKTVEAYITQIFLKLDLGDSPHRHRRVLAVLAWLRST
jgi:hypothetical protein